GGAEVGTRISTPPPHRVRHGGSNDPRLPNFWMRLLPASATKTFPLASTAIPSGALNCPSPLPGLPHFVMKEPVFVNFWMRSLPESATKTFPLPSTATPLGSRNPLPHFVRKVPVLSNFWMRLLMVSATKTLPLPSTARPMGPLNCPSPLPRLPHLVTKGQGSAGSHTHTQESPPDT